MLVHQWGWEVTSQSAQLDWTFNRGKDVPELAFLGFDNFDARRIALNAGFGWIVEGGIGTSLTKPRITWHSLLPSKDVGQRLFTGSEERDAFADKDYYETLRGTPGQCGWFSFKNVDASAPAMGLAAAAYVWGEAKLACQGSKQQFRGMAYLWPSLLPFLREKFILPDRVAA